MIVQLSNNGFVIALRNHEIWVSASLGFDHIVLRHRLRLMFLIVLNLFFIGLFYQSVWF